MPRFGSHNLGYVNTMPIPLWFKKWLRLFAVAVTFGYGLLRGEPCKDSEDFWPLANGVNHDIQSTGARNDNQLG